MRSILKTGYDKNGNKICTIGLPGERAFSIQTLGNMPQTHRNGVCNATAGEVRAYVRECGTTKQRAMLGM